MNKNFTDEQMMQAIKEQGYAPLSIRHNKYGDIFIKIRPVSVKKLGEISEWARENLGEKIIICQPC